MVLITSSIRSAIFEEPIFFFLFYIFNVRKKQKLPQKLSEVLENSYKARSYSDIWHITNSHQLLRLCYKDNVVDTDATKLFSLLKAIGAVGENIVISYIVIS